MSHIFQILTLSVPTFFHHFHYLQKFGYNSADFGHKTETMYKMEDIAHGYLLNRIIFKIVSETAKKSVLEIPIF